MSVRDVFLPCAVTDLRFKTTKELKGSDEIISQKRAVDALTLGLGIDRPGYNIFVAGFSATGKTSVIRNFLESWSKEKPKPFDWVYVFDFENASNAQSIRLTAGMGSLLKELAERAIKDLKKEIPATLQSELYENSVNAKLSTNNDKQSRKFSELEKTAKKMNFQIRSTRMGIETIPVLEGRALTEKEYNKLSDKERNKIEERRSHLEPRVLAFARSVRSLEIEAKDFVSGLQTKFVKEVVDQKYALILQKFKAFPEVIAYLEKVKASILENLSDFFDDELIEEEAGPNFAPVMDTKDRLNKYMVNLFVDNAKSKTAPVVVEPNPTYYNVFGKVEKNVEHGMFLTDFTLIKPGAIHLANGGYLVLEASDLFKMPSVWDTLKRALRARKGFIEDMGEQFSLFPTSGIRAEPIPLDLKVVLIGTDDVYHLLQEYDHEFSKLFKIKADFDNKMPRTAGNLKSYVSFVATRCHKENLLHFDRSGVAAIVEYGSRVAEDQQFLTTEFTPIKDLTIEADFVARRAGSNLIKRAHVEDAIVERLKRLNLFENHMLDMISKNEIIVTVDGRTVGQVNGLVIYDLGDHSFGKPARITCTVYVSEDGIVNVDRSSKLSGNIHDKGLLILTGFLNSFLARKSALGLSANICFEQSYGVIDGDSATLAELVAVLSAMGDIPVDQSFAMTGSLNQFGEVQTIGGVNEKIEGFCNTCAVIGKKKVYKVIIPEKNCSNLMLSKEVREKVQSGFLEIYPVRYFWEVFELVTGVPFGALSMGQRSFTKGSALEKISKRLDALAQEEVARHEKSESHSH